MFDSDEEKYFSDWLQELRDKGLVQTFHRVEEPFELGLPVKAQWTKQLKTKTKTQEFSLLNKVSYTPDFFIKFTQKALGLLCYTPDIAIEKRLPFYCLNDSLEVFIDIKGGGFGKRVSNSDIRYPIVRYMMYEKYHKLVEKIIPYYDFKKKKGLFYETFFPKSYIAENVYARDCKYGKKGESKIKFEFKTIEEYV